MSFLYKKLFTLVIGFSLQHSFCSEYNFVGFSQAAKTESFHDFFECFGEEISPLNDVSYFKAKKPYLIHEMIKAGCTAQELEKLLESKEARESLKYCDAFGSVPLLLSLQRRNGFSLAKKILSFKEGRETLEMKNSAGYSAVIWIMIRDESGFFKDDLFETSEGLKCVENIPKNNEFSLLDLAIAESNEVYINEILKRDSAKKLLPGALANVIKKWDTPLKIGILETLLEHKECRDKLCSKNKEGNTIYHEALKTSSAYNILPILLKCPEGQKALLVKNKCGLDVEEMAFVVGKSEALGKHQTRTKEELKSSVLSNPNLREKFIRLFLAQESGNFCFCDRIFYADYLKRMLALDESKPFLCELRASLHAVENIRNLTHGDKIEIPLRGEKIIYKPQTLDHAIYMEVTTRENGRHDLSLIDKGFFEGTIIIQGVSRRDVITILNQFNSLNRMKDIQESLKKLSKELPSLRGYDCFEKIQYKKRDKDKSIYRDPKLIIIPQSRQKSGNCSVSSISALIYNKFISRFYEKNSKFYADKTSYLKMKSLLIDLMLEDLENKKLANQNSSALKNSLVKKKESICKRLL